MSISLLDVGFQKEPEEDSITEESFSEEQKLSVTKLFKTILDLLKTNDTEAADRIEELTLAIQGRVAQDEITRVQRLVEGWDFDAAADRIREMATQIDIDIEG